jgi:hypothetical protein
MIYAKIWVFNVVCGTILLLALHGSTLIDAKVRSFMQTKNNELLVFLVLKYNI